MISAPDLIVGCPMCGAAHRVPQLLSANTMGAVTWTDGWMDAPMMPRIPRITTCNGCGQFFWVGEAPMLGYAKPVGVTDEQLRKLGYEGELPVEPPEWVNAKPVSNLDAAGCFRALAEGLGQFPDSELELRVLAWWRGNDEFRRADAPIGHGTSTEAVENMERFIELTENGEEDLLLFRAEAQRHLGQFDAARETLKGVCCSDYWPAKSRQLELLDAQSRKLDVLFLPQTIEEMEGEGMQGDEGANPAV